MRQLFTDSSSEAVPKVISMSQMIFGRKMQALLDCRVEVCYGV